jgi:hypothetical protein
MFVRCHTTQDERPSKGDATKGERDSRNDGEWAFRTASTVHAGSRMMDNATASRTVYRIKGDAAGAEGALVACGYNSLRAKLRATSGRL